MVTKRLVFSTSLLAAVCLASGCESMSNTAKGGLVGGGLGAGLGAVAGSASGHAGKGALIGGLVGTAAGGLIGNDVDNQEKKKLENRVVAAESRPTTVAPQATLGMMDVVQMTQQGLRDDIIINQIRATGSTFQMSTADLSYLQQNGVNPNVIAEMQNRRPVARVIREQPQVIYTRPAPPPVIVYESYPPPPVVGVGFHTRLR